jgi:hypothetical protein
MSELEILSPPYQALTNVYITFLDIFIPKDMALILRFFS